MTKREKLRNKIRNNPKSVRFSELEGLLLQFGFELVRIKGSHHFFERTRGSYRDIVVVPVHGNHVKPVYVKDVLEILDSLAVNDVDSEKDISEDD